MYVGGGGKVRARSKPLQGMQVCCGSASGGMGSVGVDRGVEWWREMCVGEVVAVGAMLVVGRAALMWWFWIHVLLQSLRMQCWR